MEPRYAAVLALVGWYLMMPPRANDDAFRPDTTAPLKDWIHVDSFDSAKECSQALAEYGAGAEKYRAVPVPSKFPRWAHVPRQAFLDSGSGSV